MNIYLVHWTDGYEIELKSGKILTHDKEQWIVKEKAADPSKLLTTLFENSGGILIYAMGSNWYIDSRQELPIKLADVISLSPNKTCSPVYVITRDQIDKPITTTPKKKWWSWF